MTAYRTTRRTARRGSKASPAPPSMASRPATTRNRNPAAVSAISSRLVTSRERLSQESSSRRSLALFARNSSTEPCIGLAAVRVDIDFVDPPLVLHARLGRAVGQIAIVEDQTDLGRF